MLNWIPEVSFRAGIGRTLEWLENTLFTSLGGTKNGVRLNQ